MLLRQSATFRKWQSKLHDPKAKALIAMRLQRLANGNTGDAAPVGEGVSELRDPLRPRLPHLFSKARGNSHFTCCCGGDKSTHGQGYAGPPSKLPLNGRTAKQDCRTARAILCISILPKCWPPLRLSKRLEMREDSRWNPVSRNSLRPCARQPLARAMVSRAIRSSKLSVDWRASIYSKSLSENWQSNFGKPLNSLSCRERRYGFRLRRPNLGAAA